MRLLVIILLLSSLAHAASNEMRTFHASPKAYAKARAALNPMPDESVSTILPLNEFLALPREKQGLYLEGLRLLMTKLEQEDQALHTEYQSASHSIFEAFLSEAVAADDNDRRCVYAGQISEMDINGRYCMAPPGECKSRGQVMCNPVLYGIVGCVSSGRRATSMCEQKKKPLNDIIADIKASGDKGVQAYSTLRSQLSDYCTSPRPTQKNVCSLIRTQLARLDRVIGKVPEPKYANTVVAPAGGMPAHVAATSSDRSGNSSNADRLHVRGPKPAASEAQDIVVAPAALKAAAAPAAAQPSFDLTRSSGNCQPAALLANMRPESVPGASPSTFMDLESARTLMCSLSPVPDWFIKQQQGSIASTLRSLKGSDKYANADRINFNGVLKNFNACVKDANTLRATGAGTVSGNFASLSVSGNLMGLNDESGHSIVGLGSVYDQEGLYKAKGISICNIQTQDGVQLAPAYGGSRSNSGDSTGAAQ